MHFKEHPLSYVLIPILILLGAASFYRFIILNEYIVSYEGPCEPETESCFVDCEDEDCTSEYYFTKIYRSAAEIRDLCGSDITDCEPAYVCPENVEQCQITFCDPAIDDEACETIGMN